MQKLCIYFMHNLEQLYYSNFTYHMCVLYVCPFSVHNLPVEVSLCKKLLAPIYFVFIWWLQRNSLYDCVGFAQERKT